MKKTLFLCLLLACVGCVIKTNKSFNQEDTSKESTKTFKEFGFSITAPCELKDFQPVNDLWNDAYYKTYYSSGLIENPDNPDLFTFYHVGVKETSKVFEDLSQAEQNELMDQIKSADFELPGSANVEKVLFSDKKFPGYVGDRKFGRFLCRSVTFNKGKYIITLTIMTDTAVMDQYVLVDKFNKFTNSFKVIE